jgi:hypothetical protein
MKKLLLFISYLLCIIPAFTQSDKEIFEYINNLKKGDIIQVGKKSGNFFYEYLLRRDNGSTISNVILIRVEDDLSSKQYRIKDPFIRDKSVTEYFNANAYGIIAFGKFGITYYADIKEALKNGEIIIQKHEQLTKENDVVETKSHRNTKKN